MREGHCTTGPKVPSDLWQVYSNKKSCCNSEFPFSSNCDDAPDEGPPTKFPTIVAPIDDDYEVVPIKYVVRGLSDSISMRDLKDEMLSVLKRILIRMQDKVPGLKISTVEEKIVINRNLLEMMRERVLVQDVTLYYNVYIVREDERKFGPLIIQGMTDSRNEILTEIQSFTDTNIIGVGDLDMNWCTSQNGKYELCMDEPRKTPRPTPLSRVPVALPGVSVQSDSDGLSVGIIALIIIILLLLICGVAAAIYVICIKDNDENKEIHNNMYMDDQRGWGNERGGRNNIYADDREEEYNGRELVYVDGNASHRSGRSRRTNANEDGSVLIECSEPQYPKFDDDSFTVNTYGTKKTSRDPTMYIPGQEGRPDPSSSVYSGSNRRDPSSSVYSGASRRYYSEDPPLKPKRDPTMYQEGQHSSEEPPSKPKRDPTMYVDGQQDDSIYTEDASGMESYGISRGKDVSTLGYESNPDPYVMEGIEEESEYDQYGFRNSDINTDYMASETDAEFTRESRDPSFYAAPDGGEVRSFRTQERSISGKSGRSKKSRQSKKSSRR